MITTAMKLQDPNQLTSGSRASFFLRKCQSFLLLSVVRRWLMTWILAQLRFALVPALDPFCANQGSSWFPVKSRAEPDLLPMSLSFFFLLFQVFVFCGPACFCHRRL